LEPFGLRLESVARTQAILAALLAAVALASCEGLSTAPADLPRSGSDASPQSNPSDGGPTQANEAGSDGVDGVAMVGPRQDASSQSVVDAGQTAVDAAPIHVVGQCGALTVGEWDDITPPGLEAKFVQSNNAYGIFSVVTDPTHSGVIYCGTENLGIWKSTDCGASWTHINTGSNGAAIDGGSNWIVVVDPIDPNVVYTNAGYGSVTNGAYKSTNGGVDWDPIWPPSDMTMANVVQYNFVFRIVMDPSNNRHLLLSFHAGCNAPNYTGQCIAETMDAGTTWRIVNGDPSWTGGEGQSVWFLKNSSDWLWGSESNGLWRTTDSGATWTLIDNMVFVHAGGQMYQAANGVFYLASAYGVVSSPDAVSWSFIPNSPTRIYGLVGDGTTLYASAFSPVGYSATASLYEPYWTAPEAAGQPWAQMSSPMLQNGADIMAYDGDHNILYSANQGAGLWRTRTK
jgi:hypothetical protein